MASNDTRGLTGQRPDGQRGQQLVAGYVSRQQPAPATFDDPVYVVLGWNPSNSFPLAWPAIHGNTLPAQGAAVLVGYDDAQPHGKCWVLSWDGAYAAPSGGGAVALVTAGDATITVGGTGTNPTVKVTSGTFDAAGAAGTAQSNAEAASLPVTDDLHAIASANATTANWSNNSKKITSLANGSASSDAAAFGQIPIVITNSSPGPPTTGAHVKNTLCIDSLGQTWTCTTAGTPGTWAGSMPYMAWASGVWIPANTIVNPGEVYVSANTLYVCVVGHTSADTFLDDSPGTNYVPMAQVLAAGGGPLSNVQMVGGDPNVGPAPLLGSSNEYADTGHVHPSPLWTPQLGGGWLAANFDPAMLQGSVTSFTVTNGVVYGIMLPVSAEMTINYVWFALYTAVGSATAGHCQAGLMDDQGNLLGVNTDIHTTVGSSGVKQIALASPVVISSLASMPAFLVLALVLNGTGAAATMYKANLMVTTLLNKLASRSAQDLTGQTALPNPGDAFGAWTQSNNLWWGAVS